MLHYYYGNGKGKTTAAIGLIIRNLGHQKSFLLAHFFKNTLYQTGEDLILRQFADSSLLSLGFDTWLDFDKLMDGQKKEVQDFYQKILLVINSENPALVVLDEITYALKYKIIDLNNFIDWCRTEKDKREIIITGIDKLDPLLEVADYVSYIQNIKHPYAKNITGREGIEF